MPVSFIGLGGNTGNVLETMQRGLFLLDDAAGIRVTDVSAVYETSPVGPAQQTVFLNAAARLECELLPPELLGQLQIVEDRLGRVRDSRWGPRPLDLDLLLHGDAVVAGPELTVPHPHLWYRRFVLDPLSGIAADVTHPCCGETIGALRELLLKRPLPVMLAGASVQQQSTIAAHLRPRFPEAAITEGEPAIPPTSLFSGVLPPSAIILDITSRQDVYRQGGDSTAASCPAEPASTRLIRLRALPGSILEAADSVLTAILDEPIRHKRPLRRMP